MADIESDPFAQNVINAIPRDIQNSLTQKQMDAIVQALGITRSQKRHMVDWRFLLRGPFRRYYVVLLIGEDRRRAVRQAVASQQARAGFRVRLALAVAALALLLLFAVVGLAFSIYLLKSALGIDLYSEEHLFDVLKRMTGFPG
ncbi:hypothetical protein ABLE93_20815 [Xanthobacter sp. KR7-65]|uniref:hypothetical protein n=1 Tax=Xanthobacter sp. KR7-65 TaxID=3156612 RepID=UPI0032B604D5